jgi:hypothetical protein
MTIPFAETPTVGLGRYIRETRFKVPPHQRDYSWTTEYVATFLEDIQTAKEAKEDLYFCGLMVLVKSDNSNFLVLDGQQRLATTIILLSAIRNWLLQFSDFHKAATQIDERYLGESELGGEEVQQKLTLNAANNDTFKRFVVNAVPVNTIRTALEKLRKSDRNRALLEATIFTNQWVEELANKEIDPEKAKDYLLSLANYITDTVQIVRLVVSGEEAAYTIFETLNDRGMDLSPLDLVKNHLFSKAERKGETTLRDLEERWSEMMTILSSVKADAFLRTFWASKHGVLEGSKLFKSFKKQYSNVQSAYSVSLEMRASAEKYVALTDSDDPIWLDQSDQARRSIRALSIIGASQMHPIILSALGKFDHRELGRLLWLLEVIAVRYQLTARGRSARVESLGARLAKMISDGAVTTATRALSELKELYIPDDQFKSDFATKLERESKKAAYLLRGLEQQARTKAGHPHPREIAPSHVTIEHILPKSPGEGWSAAMAADAELFPDHLYRLGNLCLLDTNRALGNKSFADKKKNFATSDLVLTQQVSNEQDWGRAEIESRQRFLATLAVSEWRFQ